MEQIVSISSRFAHESAASMRELYTLTEADLARIREFSTIVTPHMGDIILKWYEWLETQPEFEQFFPEVQTLHRVQGMQQS